MPYTPSSDWGASFQELDKGAPALDYGPAAGHAESIDAGRWNVLRDDLQYPLLVLKEHSLAAKIAGMAEWCRRNGFHLAPHGKTTMCPRIFEGQLAAGAWGITVAHSQQALVAIHAGASRVVLANQVVGKTAATVLAHALGRFPEIEIYCLADSVEVVEQLAAHLRACEPPRPLRVLVEWGRAGWRTGVISAGDGKSVYEAVQRHRPYLEFAGVEGFEGLAHADVPGDLEEAQVDEFLRGALAFAETLPNPENGPFVFSVGGSAFLDRILACCGPVAERYRVVLRSGCYVTHDHGYYAQKASLVFARAGATIPAFTPALELWSLVQSVNGPRSAILTFGKRDCPYDLGLPIPLLTVARGKGLSEQVALDGAQITQLNDQHAFLAGSAVHLSVGDRVCCGISHPCTAFDKWRALPVVDDNYNVLDVYRTYF